MPKTFSGGIGFRREKIPLLEHPEARPSRLSFLLPEGQEPFLLSGDLVGEGGLLAEATATEPARFSAISGRVTIGREERQARLTIQAEAVEQEIRPLDAVKTSLAELAPSTIAELLRRGGISLPDREEKRKLLIVDCAGGPYNASRVAISEAYPDDLVGGAKILMKYFGIRRCIFAIPSTARDVAQIVEERLPHRSSMLKIVLIKDKYPQSEEHLLVSAVCNSEIHAEKSCAALGYRVMSAQLCIAVFQALAYGSPLLFVPMTLTDPTGEMRVATVPLGAYLNDLPILLGVTREEDEILLSAEGIYGKPIDETATVTLSTEALRLTKKPEDKSSSPHKTTPCIGCRRCVNVCPMHLMPLTLYRAIGEREEQTIDWYDIDGCLLCGCCSAVCPSALPLTESFAAYRQSKGGLDNEK